MYPPLPTLEIAVYFVLWFCSYGWAVAQVYFKSTDFAYIRTAVFRGDVKAVQDYFAVQPFKDIVDFEWSLWNHWILKMVIYSYIFHFIVLRISELFAKQYRFHTSALFTTCFCLHFFGLKGFLFLLMQSVSCLIVTYMTESVTATWLVSIASTCVYNSSYSFAQLTSLFNDDSNLFVSFLCASSTCNLRYTAYCLEYCWMVKTVPKEEGKQKKLSENENDIPQKSFQKAFMNLMLYQFYFPLFAGGPIINYDSFLKQTHNEPVSWSTSFFFRFLFGLGRYSLWHILTNWLLHYFYFPSMHDDLRLMNSVSLLTLCGLALCYVQFFCLKYVVMYGLPAKMSVADNMNVPGAPHCVSAKHKFSFMWKYFDKGLHKWLVRYVFLPLGGSGHSWVRGTITSMLVFAFVYLWHGLRNDHLAWATLNWLGVFLEKTADKIYQKKSIQEIEKRYFSPEMSRRIRAACSTPLFSLLIISNLYFLAGITSANIYMVRIYTEDLFSTFLIHLVLYFGAQCSMEFARRGI